MLLVTALGPRGGEMLEADGDLRDPQVLIETKCLSLVFALLIHYSLHSLRILVKDLILTAFRSFNKCLGIILGPGCAHWRGFNWRGR